MSSLIGKMFDESNRIKELGNKLSKSLQNYTAARTAIRDYVIAIDDEYYVQVEQRLARATEALTQAEAAADEGETRKAIDEFRDSIFTWGAIARQVRDGFADYQEAVQLTVAAKFQALTEAGNELLQKNGSWVFGILLDAHSANAAASSYFMNGEQPFAENAERLINCVKEKIHQAEQAHEASRPDLRSFAHMVEAYETGVQEAIAQRKKAYQLFQQNLAPLGVQVQAKAEQFHHQIVERQRKSDEQSAMLMAELRHAVEHDELVLYYQPKIDLSNGAMNHVEVLVRWIHPERGYVRPDQFIPFAENTGYITAITRFVIDRALRQCAAWRKKGLSLTAAINVSTRDLLDADFPAAIARMIEANGAQPDWLLLEITESSIMEDPLKGEQALRTLRGMGLRLSIDDFGTGYSSLAYLKNLQAQELKIDKSFVMDATEDKSSVAIIRSIIELAHNMGMKVVAEGVENKETCDLLKTLGCDYIQGHYISKAIPSEQLEQWIEEFEWAFAPSSASEWIQPHAA